MTYLELSSSQKNGTLDAFGMYMYGIVLRENGHNAAARDILVKYVDASTYLELQKNNEGLQKYTKLQDVFPFSEYILGQIASGLYNSREYDQAESLYLDMIRYDSYRVDGMDIFFQTYCM